MTTRLRKRRTRNNRMTYKKRHNNKKTYKKIYNNKKTYKKRYNNKKTYNNRKTYKTYKKRGGNVDELGSADFNPNLAYDSKQAGGQNIGANCNDPNFSIYNTRGLALFPYKPN